MFAIYLVFHRLKCIFCKDAPVFIILLLLISWKRLFEVALFSFYRLPSHFSQHYLLLCETHIWQHAPIKDAFFQFCLAAVKIHSNFYQPSFNYLHLNGTVYGDKILHYMCFPFDMMHNPICIDHCWKYSKISSSSLLIPVSETDIMIAAILSPADNFTYLVRIFSGKNQLISYLRFRGADVGNPTPLFPRHRHI